MKDLVIQSLDNLSKLLTRTLTRTTLIALSLMACATLLEAQAPLHVKGRVLDEKGAPMPNVTVSVKGSTAGANGDANGNFEITVPSNATLIISSVGFEKKEVAVRGQATLSVI